MLRSARNYKKFNFSENLRTITKERNIETIQMTPFFSSTFSALAVCNIYFWNWKYSKFIFMWSPFWSILVCKMPQFFGQKLPIRAAHYTFLQSKHSEVTKNVHYVLPPTGSKHPFFKLQLMDCVVDVKRFIGFITFECCCWYKLLTAKPTFWITLNAISSLMIIHSFRYY